jgi:hypothetical protein
MFIFRKKSSSKYVFLIFAISSVNVIYSCLTIHSTPHPPLHAPHGRLDFEEGLHCTTD